VGHVKAVNAASVNGARGRDAGHRGRSGSGKTTLALAMMRLIQSDGPDRVHGRDIQGLTIREMKPLRRDMQIVFQDPYGSLSPRMTMRADHRRGAGVHGIARGAAGARELVAEIMRRSGSTRR
jgi:microcin C transport system ATP-binding protein